MQEVCSSESIHVRLIHLEPDNGLYLLNIHGYSHLTLLPWLGAALLQTMCSIPGIYNNIRVLHHHLITSDWSYFSDFLIFDFPYLYVSSQFLYHRCSHFCGPPIRPQLLHFMRCTLMCCSWRHHCPNADRLLLLWWCTALKCPTSSSSLLLFVRWCVVTVEVAALNQLMIQKKNRKTKQTPFPLKDQAGVIVDLKVF